MKKEIFSSTALADLRIKQEETMLIFNLSRLCFVTGLIIGKVSK